MKSVEKVTPCKVLPKTLNELTSEHGRLMDIIYADRRENQRKSREAQARTWEEIRANNAIQKNTINKYKKEMIMDIFEMLVEATNVIAKPQRLVKVVGVKCTTVIRGLKNTELVCEDGINRVITYRGSLSDAVPTGHIRLIDITSAMNA